MVGAIISHVLAGGKLIAFTSLLVEAGIIFFGLLTVRSHFLAGPGLAAIVVLVQSSAHIILGQSSHSNSIMLFSHVAGGLLSYKAVASSEKFWKILSECSFYLLTSLPKVIDIPFLFAPRTITIQPLFTRFALLISPSLRRAPPIAASQKFDFLGERPAHVY